ncbi:hypothetical protein SHL15_0119 [Streptomyces hygroscopicus subsp. limoneus]|nr:hypothetical protein SHL15_0119 [Streptomyces hygroscopicus subsp. limoneus]
MRLAVEQLLHGAAVVDRSSRACHLPRLPRPRPTECTLGTGLHLVSVWDAVGRLTHQSLTARPGRRVRVRTHTSGRTAA